MNSPAVIPPELLTEVWREVCRHLDIEESARGLLTLLRPHLRLEHLIVRRWDAERLRLDTVASAGGGAWMDGLGARSDLSGPRRDELLRWAAAGSSSAWRGREQDTLARALVPEGVPGPITVGPLLEGGVLVGVLVVGLGGQDGPRRTDALLEPFAAALANDHRLHELSRLREAAEQDRAALLSRLARQDVSDAIVGAEAGLASVMARVDQVAPTDAPVLILGETGSGKEVVARAVHARSRRASGPFLRVNCGAIPPELIDSELFGHERGSFTGAVNLRKGWFERADGGTLFLDEVGELPAAAQVRLLRVLQDGSFQRVGGQSSHTVDVRIVAATHRDVTTMVQQGQFRQDLWYRISVFPVTLPTLRQRRGDIPALTRHFSARAGERLFGRALQPTVEDIALLQGYDWPGNVRELASVIERAAILGGGRTLDVSTALGPGVSLGPASRGPDEREQILDALKKTRGRIEGPFGAAKLLGVNPHTLRSRMRRLAVEWSEFRKGEG